MLQQADLLAEVRVKKAAVLIFQELSPLAALEGAFAPQTSAPPNNGQQQEWRHVQGDP